MKRIQMIILVAVVVAVAAFLTVVCVWVKGSDEPPAGNKLPVTASFYPVAEFTRQVGGDNVSVTTLVKPGVEPHDYDPSPRDITAIYKSKLFVYNGAGLEKWTSKMQGELQQNGVATLVLGDGLPLQTLDEGGATYDPHIWMSPVLAIKEVTAIKKVLISVDPANKATYEVNAARYVQELRQLDSAFRSGLAVCSSRDIVTSHQAFGYLAKEYNLNMLSISGLSPDDEPSAQELAHVADFVKQHHVRYIFFEALVSTKLSRTIAQETGAQTIAFNPLEGLSQKQIDSGQNYISLQKTNLQALRTALGCE